MPSDYLPCSDYDIDEMYDERMNLINSVKTDYMHELLISFFGDADFKKKFCFCSAAKSVHHNFVGGLLEHTLSVTRVCNFFAKHYSFLDRDLLVTAAIQHFIVHIDIRTMFFVFRRDTCYNKPNGINIHRKC